MGKKSSSSSAPPPDPAIGQAQMAQMRMAQEQWDYYRNVEAPEMKRLADKQQGIADEYLAMSKQQQNKLLGWGQEAHDYGMKQREWGQQQQEKYTQQADEERARYLSEYRPFEDKILQDARDYNTEANFEKQAGYAAGDIAAAFDQQRRSAAIQRQSYGINPTSGAAMSGAGGIDAGEAAMRAAAMTRARDAAKQLGWDKNMNAAQMGQGLLSNQQAYSQMGQGMGAYALGANEAGLAATGAGLNAGAQGFGIGQQALGNNFARNQATNQTMGAAGQLYQNAGQLGVQTFGIRSNQWASQNAANAQKGSNVGSAIGAVGGIALAI